MACNKNVGGKKREENGAGANSSLNQRQIK